MRYTLYIKRVRVRETTLEKEAQTPLKTSLTKKRRNCIFLRNSFFIGLFCQTAIIVTCDSIKYDYLFKVQAKPSFVSLTSKPRAASSSRILSLKAQFLSAFAC